ncbi:MAG TPA: SDR family NAD(P)-dependent oxidoreductase, partial [Chloroflexota bacterium]|nr:SDR family NAD(P)-dependent oxidoreductase [Chloroflexota bacterium]
MARLHKRAPAPARPFEGPAALEITARGVLDNIVLRSLERRAPGPGEVELRVEAVGLNFRDVLNALGMYEGAGPLGSECVGTVVAVGDGVSHLEIGQLVMGMAAGALRDYVCVPADGLADVPPELSVEAAATVPIVFLTAVYGLEEVAGLRAGERVLIHAGAGGVGLAAIQVAQAAGAEVYATAGSEEKRGYLRGLGVRHVFNSRTVAFAEEVLSATGGAGVDVVLNALTGEFIEASVRALGRGGRFVELGKGGVWSAEAMAAARPDVAYTVVYLGDVPPTTIQTLWERVRAGLRARTLRALPRRVYGMAEAAAAFRYMAQAKHIGKLVVRVAPAPGVRGDGTYLVTGAFGGVGTQVVRWLVREGARSLVLVGRRGAASPEGAALVAELEAAGASVTAAAMDVSDGAAVERLVRGLAGPPLRGVVHAAGVLDDGVLAQQTWARCARVFEPKVAGAWALDRATAGQGLDWFVVFSSMVTVVGAPGQGNYAAANAVLDALAHARRARGQAGMSINWGPWADAGMSASVSELDRQRWQRQGISFIKGPQGVAILGHLLEERRSDASAQVAVLPIQWPVLLQQFPAGAAPPLFADLVRHVGTLPSGATAAADGAHLLERLRGAPPGHRRGVAVKQVSALALRVLGLDPSTSVDPGRPLQEFGLDSLMAVELR